MGEHHQSFEANFTLVKAKSVLEFLLDSSFGHQFGHFLFWVLINFAKPD